MQKQYFVWNLTAEMRETAHAGMYQGCQNLSQCYPSCIVYIACNERTDSHVEGSCTGPAFVWNEWRKLRIASIRWSVLGPIPPVNKAQVRTSLPRSSVSSGNIRGCIQKFPDWPPGA
jgi:hypothetical protein